MEIRGKKIQHIFVLISELRITNYYVSSFPRPLQAVRNFMKLEIFHDFPGRETLWNRRWVKEGIKKIE